MEKSDLKALLARFVNTNPYNFVSAEQAITSALADMRIFDEPLIGVAGPSDDYFWKMQEPDIVGPHFILPTQWLSTAQSVMSFFFPFTQVVKKSNQADMSWPSNEWLHARIEGQAFLIPGPISNTKHTAPPAVPALKTAPPIPFPSRTARAIPPAPPSSTKPWPGTAPDTAAANVRSRCPAKTVFPLPTPRKFVVPLPNP